MRKRIVQLTDLHLQASSKALYKGVNADAHFLQCLEWLSGNQCDLLLLTGDLAHGASPASYARLQGYLADIGIPWLWLPGNHDDAQQMLAVSDQAVDQVRQVELADWRLLILDTTYAPDGKGSGSVSPVHMQHLQQQLEVQQDKPVLLVMHHNPIPVNSAWQDEIMLGNSQEFNQLVTAYSQVKAVVFGHVHQPIDRVERGVRYLATPATSVQFLAQQDSFMVQAECGPGLRIIDLLDANGLQTQVVNLPKLSPPAEVM